MPSPTVKSGPVALVSLLAALWTAAPAAAAPRVVASIPPVHALAATVMAGVGEPALLVPGGASPHTYQLRPSQARALSEADLVLWVGEELETFLVKPLATLSRQDAVIELIEAPGVTTLPFRIGGAWDAHAHGEEATHEEEDHAHGEEAAHEEEDHAHGHDGDHAADDEHAHHHGGAGADPHIWLDPDNALAIARAIAAALSEIDPANAGRYGDNVAAFETQLMALDEDIRERLAPVVDRPFVVFHDAYQYFDRHFGLHAVGAVTVSPDRQPGPAHLAELREKIERLGAVCIFAEPQFPPRLIGTVSAGTGARTGTLDPVGADLTPGPNLYPALIRRMADDLATCLEQPS